MGPQVLPPGSRLPYLGWGLARHTHPALFPRPNSPAGLRRTLVLPEGAAKPSGSSSWPEAEAARTVEEKVHETRPFGAGRCQEEEGGEGDEKEGGGKKAEEEGREGWGKGKRGKKVRDGEEGRGRRRREGCRQPSGSQGLPVGGEEAGTRACPEVQACLKGESRLLVVWPSPRTNGWERAVVETTEHFPGKTPGRRRTQPHD